MYGIRRAIFHPELDDADSPAHRYLRSVHNILIERGWFRLRLYWGDNVYIFFMRGQELGIYNAENPQH
jgi:hypothetical protein